MREDKITIAELKILIDAREVVVIDVRSTPEFAEGHIWSSLHLPVESLPGSARDVSKESLVVTVCNKGGGRSERAASILAVAGWKNTRWLEGGYLGWTEAGFPDYEPGFASS